MPIKNECKRRKNWSQIILLKVLGGLFVLQSNANASPTQEAINRAREAAVIQLGIKSKINSVKGALIGKIKQTLKRAEMLNEVAIVAGAAQIVKEKGVGVTYMGVDYFFTPTEFKVIIHF